MPMSFSARNVATPAKNLYQRWFPKVGITLDWAGLTACLLLKPEGLNIGLDESAKPKLTRLKFLPRTSFSLQINSFNFEAKTTSEVKTPIEVWSKLSKTPLAKADKPKLTA